MVRKSLLLVVFSILISFVFAACAANISIDVLFYVDDEEYGALEFTGTEAKNYRGKGYEKKKDNGNNKGSSSSITSTTIELPADPEKDDLVFDGWYYDKDVWEKPFTLLSLLETPIKDDVKLKVYARFVTAEAQVEFDTDGGNEIAAIEVLRGEKANAPQTPVKNGYTFEGWYLGDKKWEFATYTVDDDMTLKAKWSLNTYTITYEGVNGAENTNPTRYDAEDDEIFLSKLTRNGYNFLGWFDSNDNLVTKINTGSYGNITLTAKWESVAFKIKYQDLFGAVNTNPDGYNKDSDDIVLSGLTRNGYEFKGWVDSDGEFVTTIPSGSSGDIVLKAKWSAITYDIEYKDVFGADNDNPTEYDIEDSDIKLVSLERDGYNFLGWYDKDDNLVKKIPAGSFGEITLTAKWVSIGYKIKYYEVGNAQNINPTSYTSDSEDIVLVDLEKPGYEFKGWYDLEGIKVSVIPSGSVGDKTLLAKWTLLNYDIKYNDVFGAQNGNPTRFNIEDSDIILNNINHDGYKFNGWFDENGEQVTEIPAGSYGDIKLTAKWELLPENITLNQPYIYTGSELNTLFEVAQGITVTASTTDAIVENTVITISVQAKDTNNVKRTADYKVTVLPSGLELQKISTDKYKVVKYTQPEGLVVDDEFTLIVPGMLGDSARITVIGDDAFNENDMIDYLTIPDTVVEFGERVFYGCEELKKLTVPFVGSNTTQSKYIGWFFGADNYTKNNTAVPWWLQELVVTGGTIGNRCFDGWERLTSVVLGDNVTIIGEYAFENCKNLSSIVLGKNITTIRLKPFRNTNITSITIPESVKNIANGAFDDMFALREFNYNAVNASLDTTVNFCNTGKNSGAVRVNIGANVTKIPNGLFYNNSNFPHFINEIIFAEDTVLTEIGAQAFFGCNRVSSIKLPDGVTVIGNNAFKGMTKISEFYVPKSVKTIGNTILSGCTGITKVYYNAEFANDLSDKDTPFMGIGAFKLVVGKSVKRISAFMFANTSVTDISFEDGAICTRIQYDCFKNCKSLTKVVLAPSVNYVDERCFDGCSNLKDVTLSPAMIELHGATFRGCTSLETINLHEGIRAVTGHAFSGCTSLKSIVLPSTMEEIRAKSFYNCSSIKTINIPENVILILENAFEGCTGITEVHITNYEKWQAIERGNAYSNPCLYGAKLYLNGEEVKVVDDSGNISLPQGVTVIDGYTYSGNTSITDVIIPVGVTKIEANAFKNCINLSTIVIPNTVEYIGENAFSGCITLEEIELPSNLENLNNGVFSGCTSLTTVRFNDALKTIGEQAFKGCTKLEVMVLNEGLLSIGAKAFDDCTSLTGITIPTSLVSLGNMAFDFEMIPFENIYISYDNTAFVKRQNCFIGLNDKILYKGIAGAVIPSDGSVTVIGDYAFSNCKDLTGKLIIPGSITEVGEYAFRGTGITALQLNNGVKVLKNNAFHSCSSLTDVNLGSTLTDIGNACFSGCSFVTISLPSSLKHIGPYGLNVSTLRNVTISGSTTWYLANSAGIMSGENLYQTIIYNSNSTSSFAQYFRNNTLRTYHWNR